MIADVSWNMTVSVISRTRRSGGRPVSSRIPRTSSTKLASWSCCADRLTAIVSGWPPAPSRIHAAAWRHASPRTQRPRGRMSPVSSASGMNTSGSSNPRVG